MSDLAVRPRSLLSGSLTMAGRSLRLTRRQVDALLTSLMLPIMLMLCSPICSAARSRPAPRYVTYLVPGVLLLCEGFGSATTSVSVSGDLNSGIIDRFRSLDVSGLSAAFGVLARTPEAAGGMTFFMMFVPYASSAFVPIGTMPSWLHGFARHQPVTPVIETLRGLLLDRPVGDAPGQALAWCGGILVVSAVLSAVFFRRRTR